MNRTIEEATAKRFPSGSHDELPTQLTDGLSATNLAPRLKTPNDLAPSGYSCEIGTSEPDRLILDPIRMPGLNS